MVTEVQCSCGATLVDALADEDIRVGDDEFRFARSTDYVACAECGFLHKVTDLREGIVGGHSQTDEALEVLRDLALEDPVEDDPARIVGRVPADD